MIDYVIAGLGARERKRPREELKSRYALAASWREAC